MRGKVTNIIPRMYGKSDFFTYFSVSPHSDDKEKLHLQQVTTLRGDKKSCRIKENNKYTFYN